MLKKNDIVEIEIEDLTVDGAGIGRYGGLAVFVPRALPAERVSVRIIKLTKNYAVGRLESVLRRSEHRRTPFCGVFEACGGCTLQHLDYGQQVAFKARHIQQCFRRIGGIEIALPDVVQAENIRDYRNKASFPVASVDGMAQAGFFAPRSHRLVTGECPIQKKPINDIKNAVISWANAAGIPPYDEVRHTGLLRHIVARQASDGALMAGVVLRNWTHTDGLVGALRSVTGIKSIVINRNEKKHNAILGGESRTVWGDAFITETYDGLRFRAGLTSFLQVNHEQSARLYRMALDLARISETDIVFDLFCGIGTMTLLAARSARFALGIEYVPEAAENAQDNARLNGIGNAAFLAGDAGELIDVGVARYGAPDIVLLDPPRRGCDAALIEKIAAAAPKRVVYVSCNPSTLARDAVLFARHGYGVRHVRGVDMFPHTTHVECVTLMSRAEK